MHAHHIYLKQTGFNTDNMSKWNKERDKGRVCCGEQDVIDILLEHLPFTTVTLNLVSQHSVPIQQGYGVSALADPPPHSQNWPVTSLPAHPAKLSAMSLSVLQPPPYPTHVAAVKTDTHTHSLHPLLTSCFVLYFQQDFKLVWMCYIRVCQSKGPWQPCRGKRLRIWAASSTGLSLTSLPPLSSASLLHQLIQAWSDTWASGVSVAIKMPPLQHFNWNFCCWCVNSCRTEKGRSIIPALHRPPEVKWQQLLWQENPQSSCLFMILLLHPPFCTISLTHLHIHVWLWNEGGGEREHLEWYGAGLAKWNDQQGRIYRLMRGSHTHTSRYTHTGTNSHTLLWNLFSPCRHKSIIHFKMTHFSPCGSWQ